MRDQEVYLAAGINGIVGAIKTVNDRRAPALRPRAQSAAAKLAAFALLSMRSSRRWIGSLS
jgi:hypothetical protein